MCLQQCRSLSVQVPGPADWWQITIELENHKTRSPLILHMRFTDPEDDDPPCENRIMSYVALCLVSD